MQNDDSSNAQQPWDVVVCGAGPIGLAAATFSARAGIRTLVIEQSSIPGPLPRGETVRDHPVFTELLGSGVMESFALHRTALRRYNSPNSKKRLDFSRSAASLVFRWHDFIEGLYDSAKGAGVEFRFGSTVVAPYMKDDICQGVVLEDGGVVHSDTVLACDGHDSVLGRASGVDYEGINCPTVKRLASNFKGDYDGFEFFFIARGTLDYAPDFPPSVLFIFPREDGHCETGMMVLPRALGRSERKRLPDEGEMLDIWHRIMESYPRFSELMRNTKTELEHFTQIPNARMVPRAMNIPGLALLGDSGGFIEASGGSGISVGMREAKECVAFLSDEVAKTWDSPSMKEFNRHISRSAVYRHVKKIYHVIAAFQFVFFRCIRTGNGLNRWWWLARALMKLH